MRSSGDEGDEGDGVKNAGPATTGGSDGTG